MRYEILFCFLCWLTICSLVLVIAEDGPGKTWQQRWRQRRRSASTSTTPTEDDTVTLPTPKSKSLPPHTTRTKEPSVHSDDSVGKKDFPLFIVAGTQKSGTTALAAYLTLHPNITMSTKKELHFFDKNNNYQQGLVYYYDDFVKTETTMMFGEATPSYVASRAACARITKHFPDTKLIILLREPVIRAYSEYQMKKRRIDEQLHFRSWMERNALTAIHCLWKHPHNYNLIAACLPSTLRHHNRMSKFTKALKKSMTKWSSWDKTVEACFPMDAFLALQLSAQHQSQASLHYAFNRTTYYFHQKAVLHQPLFDMKGCWTNYKEGYESVGSIDESLQQEVQHFQQCAQPIEANLTQTLNIPKDDFTDEQQLDLLDQQINSCIKVKSGISSQYFYRSLYAAQLYHCFKVSPLHRLFASRGRLKHLLYCYLIVDSSRTSASATIRGIAQTALPNINSYH